MLECFTDLLFRVYLGSKGSSKERIGLSASIISFLIFPINLLLPFLFLALLLKFVELSNSFLAYSWFIMLTVSSIIVHYVLFKLAKKNEEPFKLKLLNNPKRTWKDILNVIGIVFLGFLLTMGFFIMILIVQPFS